VPGWLEWFGELGIGLPLTQGYDSVYGDVRVCYWHLNWGRILLQNVSITDPRGYKVGQANKLNLGRELSIAVPEAGGLLI
jgi:hypothetical protein